MHGFPIIFLPQNPFYCHTHTFLETRHQDLFHCLHLKNDFSFEAQHVPLLAENNTVLQAHVSLYFHANNRLKPTDTHLFQQQQSTAAQARNESGMVKSHCFAELLEQPSKSRCAGT